MSTISSCPTISTFIISLIIRRPPRSTLFPTRRSSDLSTTIGFAELNLLDGHDVALVDTNDAVATAITGTGALKDRKSTRLNSSHLGISYAVFCLKKKNYTNRHSHTTNTTPRPNRPRIQ